MQQRLGLEPMASYTKPWSGNTKITQKTKYDASISVKKVKNKIFESKTIFSGTDVENISIT